MTPAADSDPDQTRAVSHCPRCGVDLWHEQACCHRCAHVRTDSEVEAHRIHVHRRNAWSARCLLCAAAVGWGAAAFVPDLGMLAIVFAIAVSLILPIFQLPRHANIAVAALSWLGPAVVLGFSPFFFGRWSPEWEAMMYTGAGLLNGGAALYLLSLQNRLHPSGHCQKCGYCLRGLTEPRCPECGTPFDLSLLRILSGRPDSATDVNQSFNPEP